MKRLIAMLFLGAVASASGAQGLVTNGSIRVPSGQLVMHGDSEGQVLAKFGRAPDRETTIENARGAAVGQRWIYIEPGYSGRIVTLEIVGGKVDRLWSERLK